MRYLLVILFFISGCGIHKSILDSKGPSKKVNALKHPKKIIDVIWLEKPEGFEPLTDVDYVSYIGRNYLDILNGKYQVKLAVVKFNERDRNDVKYAYQIEIIQYIKYTSTIVDELIFDIKYISTDVLNKPIEEIVKYNTVNQTLEFHFGKSTFKCKLILEEDYYYTRYKKK